MNFNTFDMFSQNSYRYRLLNANFITAVLYSHVFQSQHASSKRHLPVIYKCGKTEERSECNQLQPALFCQRGQS